jgi:apolipoprotein N-acyltransferase
VKIAGIAVGQQADYWDEILEKGVPEEEAAGYRGDFARLEATLMQKSEQAAMAGAKIVFWSESNLFAYENDLPGLLARAQDFAREHRIYFAPSIQVLRFGSTVNDSRSVMIRPDGEIAYTNKKHVSWYRTDSDGIIRYVDTPYGRIGSAICFDMDSPGYIRQAGANSVDIMLVPAYDTEGGSPYHTYVGLLRGPENGFSVFRSVSHGTSIAIDYEGNARAEQDYFSSPDGILFADLPTKGARTPYAASGDWLAYASFLFLLAILVSRMAPARRRSDSHA